MPRSVAAFLQSPLSRRSFFWSGANVATLARFETEPVHQFMTPEYEIRMTLEFYDRCASDGFWFQEELSHRDLCFSSGGEQDRNCLKGFRGAMAVARYQVLPRSQSDTLPVLRELVRSIDGSEQFPRRPPFERTLVMQRGVASDVQAFGYQANAPTPDRVQVEKSDDLWCLLRQDLYFQQQAAPFLVLHWKHTLQAIRVLDIIPGRGTLRKENRRQRR